MRIDLRSCERSVTKELLDGAQVRAALEKVRRGSVPQSVRTEVWSTRDLADQPVDEPAYRPLVESTPSLTEEQRGARALDC
jgi:hypothetical protein